MQNNTIGHWQDTIISFFIQYGLKIVGAVIILTAGLLFARAVGKWFDKWLGKHHLEPPIRLLFVRLLRLVILALIMVIVLDQVGVQIAPLIAGIGVAGVGIGLAMQGMLGNIVAGLTIIFTKPYRVGEYIELLGVYGQVTNIELFSTVLIHGDRSRVVIPNRKVIGEILHNYGTVRQLDLTVGVAYASDMARVVSTVQRIVEGNARVLKEPSPVVGISSLGESAINVSVKPWVKVPDFASVQLELYQAIVEQFRANKIDIPSTQRELRILDGSRIEVKSK